MQAEDLKTAIKFAQSALSVNGRVSVDGIWGNRTQEAYQASSYKGVVKASMKAVHPKATPEVAYTAFKKPKASLLDEGEVIAIITSVAKEFGERTVVMVGKARIESGLNPQAVNGSYAGLYQMGESAWADARVAIRNKGFDDIGTYSANKFDARQNARAACGYRIALRNQLRSQGFTGSITESVLYLAHQQGAAGYVGLVKAAETGARVTPRQEVAMRRNPPQDGKGVTLDPAEFVQRWSGVTEAVLVA